jgi:hypothetical protein
MAAKTVYVVQAFVKRQRKLVPLPKSEAPSEAHALYRAERVAAQRAGAAVIKVIADDETGEVSEAKVLD